MTNFEDTIIATATPSGVSALAVIRVSGNDAISIVNSCFSKDIKKADGRDMWKDTSADLDNMNKGLADIMEKLGFFKNDGQIASLTMYKIWAETPRVEIELEEMKPYVE